VFTAVLAGAIQPTPTANSLSAEQFLEQPQHQTKTAPEIARAAFPSVVLITTQDPKGQPISLGSGFFVAKDTIATNFHVIDGASAGYAKVIGEPAKLTIEGVINADALRDLALLKVSSSSTPALQVADKISINTGDPVFAIGNPRGLEGTFSQGIVSSIRQIAANRILQITAPISPGSSGGPVLDETGTVVGVAVASIANAQNLNFAVPSDYLFALQKAKPDPRPLNSFSHAKSRQSFLDQVGNKQSRDGVVGTNLTYDRGPSSGFFSYSLQNKLRDTVRDIVGVIVFYNVEGEPLDVAPIDYKEIIPAGLAKRVTGRVDGSVETLNSPDGWRGPFPLKPKGKVEFRIFDFAVAD
jgi:hypothetical protein